MTAKVNISFFGILSITRYSRESFIGNVPYPHCVKKWIKEKTAYCSDVEQEENRYCRKLCIMLTLEQLKTLHDEIGFEEKNQTLGSLTVEYGLIEAVSLSCYDYYHNIEHNLYLSVIPNPNCDQKHWENLSEMWEFKQFYNEWQEYPILEYLDEQREDLPLMEKEFILNQLTLAL